MNHNDHQPICPKCGYDLTGEIATWNNQCPLQGVCSECGYAFAWSEPYRILNEWGSEVGWYAEHAHSMGSMLKRTPGTALRIVFPSVFFRTMNFRRHVSIKKLCIWMIAMSAMLWVLSSIPAGYACSVEYSWATFAWELPSDELGWMYKARDLLNALSFPYLHWYDHGGLAMEFGSEALWNAFLMSYGIVPFIAISCFWTLIVFAIPTSRPHALRNPRLIMRGILLSMAPAVLSIIGVRILTSMYVYRGWRYQDEWILYTELVWWFICLFWQQCIWTAFVRWGLGVKPSWYVNLPGFVVSLIFGFIAMLWFIL